MKLDSEIIYSNSVPTVLWGLGGWHLSDLYGVLVKPVSNIFEWLWRLGEIINNLRKANITPIFKMDNKVGVGNSQSVSLPWIPEKIMKWILLGNISGHMKEKKMMGTVSVV